MPIAGRGGLCLPLITAFVLAAALPVSSQTLADKGIAARYAPVFHEALGDHPLGDYPTNFNFDGDWIGTNNWAHAEDRSFRLLGYIYYSVVATTTHYYIHYAVFHARDYKGGEKKGVILSDILRKGAEIASEAEEPTGLLAEAALAHENDMEGALVVVEKATSKVVFLETLHHNKFSLYTPDGSERAGDGHFKLDGEHVELYIEPKGHGIEAWGTEGSHPEKGFLVYRYTGKAEDPEKSTDEKVGYDLLPIATTLWPKAKVAAKNAMFASFRDYGTVTISVTKGTATVARKVILGKLASAFDGKVGGVNMARPPWGWFSNEHRDDPPGLWYFDPAKVVKRDFALPDSFSTVYTRTPFWAALP